MACATLLYTSMNGAANAEMNLASTSFGFNAIVSVIVGQYLADYCGPLVGVYIGSFTMRILAAGLLSLGIAATWQRVANGIFLILFLGFSQNQKIIGEVRRRREKAQQLKEKIPSAN